VHDGYISITPLQPDLTDYTALERLETLVVEDMPLDPVSRQK
jgi:hypothetical protein